MKDSKQVRSEHQSFVDAYGQIAEASVQPEEDRKRLTKSNPAGTPREPLGGDRRPMVKVRKEGAFTEQAEKYEMSVKQFARFVEANQLLFSVETRKKAQVANAFQGFKETTEWDEFFEDTEMVEDLQGTVKKALDKGSEFMKKNPVGRALSNVMKPVGPGKPTARPSVRVQDRIRKNQAGMESLEWDEKEINDLILEVTTKETKSGTKYKVRVKHKETGSSYIRYATREMIASMRNDPKISSVEMTDEGDAPEEKGEKKALEKGGGDIKKSDEKQDTKQAADKGAGFASKVKKRSVTTEAKKLDPVGKEDEDIDNDGDVDSSDKYLHKRRKAIGKAMKKESFGSDWRQDLSEVMDDEDKKKAGKVKNKVEVMPKMEGYGEKTCKKCGKNPCECPKEEVASEGEVTEGRYQGGGALRPTDRIKMGDGSLKSLNDIDAKLKEKGTKKEETEQIDEIAPAVGAGLIGAGLAAYKAISGMRAASKVKQNAASGKGKYGAIQRATDTKNKALQMLNQETEVDGETLEEGPAALAIKLGLGAGTAIAGTKIGQEAIKKVRGMVQKKKEREAPYQNLLNK